MKTIAKKAHEIICLTFTIEITKYSEILKNEETKKKKMEKMVLALSSGLTTCLLPLQCYGIFALKLLRERSKSSYIESETVLSRNDTIAQFKRMRSR